MTNICLPQIIFPDWHAPRCIQAAVTTRLGGMSSAPWHSLNLAMHVGDDFNHVMQNREIVGQQLCLPSEPVWLEQVHGCDVANADFPVNAKCDASVSCQPDVVCAVMTADCLPLLLTTRQGDVVAAAHAGWRGLADGVIESTLNRMNTPATEIIAWLGPAIGPNHFEVGEDVLDAFVSQDPAANSAFTPGRTRHWYCDIYALARQRLMAFGVTEISGGELCTYADAERFYSYRRDGVTGRMASLIWIKTGD